jgi:hypothetical protein
MLVASDPKVSTFSARDAGAFVEAHGFAGGKIRSTTATAVEKVEFLPNREVTIRLRTSPNGLPDDTLLCLVTVRGSFDVVGPPRRDGRVVNTSNTAYVVFDAHTGNLLMRVQGPVTSSKLLKRQGGQ